ncbi:MAG TPA: sodium:solute symporter family protein, partial [Armatimonadetes bacterium]|nr:sodium:solute symporter family protein [Armatimonadota bacterium]
YIRGLSHFIVAGRALRIYLGVATLVGTEIGLVTVVYNAQEGFERGFSAWTIGIIQMVSFIIIGTTGFIVSQLRERGVMTIPEFYEQRFDKRVRWLGGLVLALSGILNMGLFLQAGGKFVTAVLGIEPGWGLKVVMTVMLLMVLFYTTLGGMVSVVLTDFVQFVVLSFGMVITTFIIISKVGWSEVFDTVATRYQLGGFNPIANPNYGWLWLAWQSFGNFAAATLWQPSTLRALSAHNPIVARRIYFWASVAFLARVMMPAFWGMCALTLAMQLPEMHKAFFGNGAQTLTTDFAMPMLIARALPTGLLGNMTAGMLAAFMSTHDSYLLCWSSVITQDVIAPLCRRGLSERARMWLTRIGIILIGLFLLIWGLWYETPTTLWNYMLITGTIYLAGAFVVVVAGLHWKRASSTGALLTILAGTTALFGLRNWELTIIGKQFILTQHHIGFITIVLCILAMVVGSLLFPDKPKIARS